MLKVLRAHLAVMNRLRFYLAVRIDIAITFVCQRPRNELLLMLPDTMSIEPMLLPFRAVKRGCKNLGF